MGDAKNLRATGRSEGHCVLFPSFKVPRAFVGMLLCEQPKHAYGCFGAQGS